jgi:preprotein translocase SecF subunit
LDIDFVGGVSVEAVFKEKQNITQVRQRLESKNKAIVDAGIGAENRLTDLSVQNVLALEAEDTRFIITNSIPQVPGMEVSPDDYLDTVRKILRETFGEELEYRSLDYTIGESKSVADYAETTVEIKRFPRTNYESLNSEIRAVIRKAAADGLIEGEFSPPSVMREGYGSADWNPQQPFADWTLTFRIPRESLEKVLDAWKTELDNTPNFPTSTAVGGSVARHTRIQGTMAIIASLVFMAIYIAVRFHRWQYGLIAVIGLLHDVLVVLGLLALSKWFVSSVLLIDEFKIGLPVVAAFLTVIAYSINDTIILFDRIRENLGKSTILYASMINLAINQTLSRTVLTSGTTFLVAMILYIFGGQGIHAFSFAIAVGILCGTYSTIGICSALLFWAIGKDDLGPGETLKIEKMER